VNVAFTLMAVVGTFPSILSNTSDIAAAPPLRADLITSFTNPWPTVRGSPVSSSSSRFSSSCRISTVSATDWKLVLGAASHRMSDSVVSDSLTMPTGLDCFAFVFFVGTSDDFVLFTRTPVLGFFEGLFDVVFNLLRYPA